MISRESTYSIGEVSHRTGFKPHVIRYYEKEFNLIIPREENSRRIFTDNEIQQLLYIKELQNQGIGNKEIKEILKNSIKMTSNNIDNELSITNIDMTKNWTDIEEHTYIDNILKQFKNDILITLEKHNYKKEINELKQNIEELRQELIAKDQDILICENAKLKLKIKEKSYEVAELKEKLKRQEYQKLTIFQRLLKAKNHQHVQL